MIGFRRLLRRRVIVNLKTGTVLEGLLFEKRGPLIVLREAKLLVPSGRSGPQVVDGEAVFERRAVDFYQVLPSGVAKGQ